MSVEEPPPRDDTSNIGLIETLLWMQAGGYAYLGLHLDRIANSARALGHAYDEDKMRAALETLELPLPQMRVRILLSHSGEIAVSAQALSQQSGVWKAAVADRRLRSSDPLLAHKTTRREIYDGERARLASEKGADEAIFLNERDELCEGGITTIFVERDGLLLTPPLARGLLPGVLRRYLIETGKAREADVDLGDLAHGFLLGNSVRGLITSRLIG